MSEELAVSRMQSSTPSTALLRIALVSLLQDPAASLTPVQRAWLTTRLRCPTPLTPREVTRLAPALRAWATAKGHTAVLTALGEEAPHA